MSDNQYQSDNENIWEETANEDTQNEEIDWGSDDENEVVAPVPRQPEGTATVGGMRTAYDERSAFVGKLQELFAKIDELNRPTPMNEGEYLEFANLIKDLNQFATLFKKSDPIYVRLVASARRGERKATQSVIAKAEDKEYKWCERCDTHIKKKGWAKHRRSERCLQIYNSKKLAVNITNVEKQKVGRFAKTPIHPFYLIGQSLVSQFSKQKEANAETRNAEWDAVRLPIQTQQIPDEVGDLESVYDVQENYETVVANVVAPPLTLALPLSAGETEETETAPKEKKARKPRTKKPKPAPEPEPEPEPEVSEEPVVEPPKKKGGRPKGSKNAPKIHINPDTNIVVMSGDPPIEPLEPAERRVLNIKAKKPKKKIIVEPETPPPAEETKEPEPEVVQEVPKRYVAEGIMRKSFYEKYIREKMSEKGQNLMDAVYGNYKEIVQDSDCDEDEDFVEYRVCGWDNPRDGVAEYSELWFFDCETEQGYYYPVVVSEINTSSAYAMCRCGMDRDPDAEEVETLMLTDEEIVALVKPRNHERIMNILKSQKK
jgi:hypothetical protein